MFVFILGGDCYRFSFLCFLEWGLMEVKMQLFFLSLSLLDHRGKISQACNERRNGGGGGRRGCPYMKVATGSGKFGVCLKTQLLLLCLLQTHPEGRKHDVCFVAAACACNFRFIGSRSCICCTECSAGVFY